MNKVLSLEGFSRYLLDKENYAFVNEHTKVNEKVREKIMKIILFSNKSFLFLGYG
jgi:hypothetical protein